MQNNPIGIIDSGVGGLSIWQEIVAKLPHESTIYLADTKNCPYGSREQVEIARLSEQLVLFLLKQEVKLIVIACNTMTVSCLDYLRSTFPQTPFIGTVPVVKTAAALSKKKRIGILSTKRTAQSAYQAHLIQQFAAECLVVNHGTNALVPFVERGEVTGAQIEAVLEEELSLFQEADIDVLALGCSHYPFLRTSIAKILGPDVLLLDSGQAIARQAERVLVAKNALAGDRDASHTFHTTGDTETFIKVSRQLVQAATPVMPAYLSQEAML